LGGGHEPPVLTCTESGDLLLQEEHLGRRVASDDTSAYKVVTPFDVVYNPYLLWAGAIGQNTLGLTGITSPVYEVFRPTPLVKPRFAGLLLTSPAMVRSYDAISIGSIPRRRRAPWPNFLSLPVRLPPLEQQSRIVDLVSAVVAQEDRLRGVVSAASALLAETRETLLSSSDWVSLGDLIVGITAGKSPPAGDRSPRPDEFGVLKVSAVRFSGFDPTESKVLNDESLMPADAKVRTGDLLITRANTRQLVGSVCVVDDTPPNLFLCDKTLRLAPKPRVDTHYLCEALQLRAVREQIEDAATGTSASMKNISQSSIRGLRIPRPDDRTVSAIEVLRCLRETAAAAHVCRHRTRRLHDALVAVLLCGDHLILDAYDSLVEAV
jgi:type I restriction enzyme S subunit